MKHTHPFHQPLIYHIGSLTSDRYWIERPDGILLQIDHLSKEVLERAANHESIPIIAKKLEISEEEILLLLKRLGLEPDLPFTIKGVNHPAFLTSSQKGHTDKNLFYNPWLERQWFKWGIVLCMVLSIVSIVAYIQKTPVTIVTSLYDQWIIVGALTISVLIHELGHFLCMPRTKGISISIQWAGPIPLFSIICNEAWKLTKYQRIRINLAGFVADLLVGGLISTLGIFFDHLSPWIWTFLIVHMIRMVLAVFPLLPGDGYWILVDLWNQPNLWKHARLQLQQFNINWHSLYALMRIIFMIITWFLYAYMIGMWTTFLFKLPVKEALLFLLRPAPLILFLNLLYLLYVLFTTYKQRKGKARDKRKDTMSH